jgi:hypothetical protein
MLRRHRFAVDQWGYELLGGRASRLQRAGAASMPIALVGRTHGPTRVADLWHPERVRPRFRCPGCAALTTRHAQRGGPRHHGRGPSLSWVGHRGSLGISTEATRSPAPGRSLKNPDDRNQESPVRCKSHAGFGERSGETDREQSRHRAPGRLIRRAEVPQTLDCGLGRVS